MSQQIDFPCRRILLLENDVSGGFLSRCLSYADDLVGEVRRILTLAVLRSELERRQSDIILAEYPLLCIDGVAVIRFRNRYAPGLPLIFVSDGPGEDNLIEALCLGCKAGVFWVHRAGLPGMVRHVVGGLDSENEWPVQPAAPKALEDDAYRVWTLACEQDGMDAETGLLNRPHFSERLDALCRDNHAAVCLFEVEFVPCGGMDNGEEDAPATAILEHAVDRLLKWLGSGDLLARVGEYRFAFVLDEALAQEAPVALLIDRLRDPILIGGRLWSLPVHLAMAHYPGDATDAASLMQCADDALRCAERDATLRHCICLASSAVSPPQRQQVEVELREALVPEGGLQLLYQPQAELAGGRIVGIEAFLSWRHPRLGKLSAGDFVPLAEFSGLMPMLDCWVLNQACLQLRQWRDLGIRAPCLSLTLSPGQFASSTLIGDIERTLAFYDIEGSALELGLTEAATMRDPVLSAATMTRLRELGVKLLLKDFGSGYSSLVALKRFPLTRLKLDRSFVDGIAIDAGDLAIARALIMLAHELCLDVVAESVETREQLSVLIESRCEAVQGYLFSPPVSADACRNMLVNGLILQLD